VIGVSGQRHHKAHERSFSLDKAMVPNPLMMTHLTTVSI
jgi:hypothetical protein